MAYLSRKLFVKVINELERMSKDTTEAVNVVSLHKDSGIEFETGETVIYDILNEIFVDSAEYISTWCIEHDFGRVPYIIEEDDCDIEIKSADDLYTYLTVFPTPSYLKIKEYDVDGSSV